MWRTSGVLAAALLAGSLLAGCSGKSDEVPPVTPANLAAEISGRVAEDVGLAPEVTCPEELPAEAGASVTCTIAASEEVTAPLDVVATVTSVDTESGVVHFDIAVDSQPTGDEGGEG